MIAKRVRELIREICLANEIQIIQGHVSNDHIHLLISYPPRLSVAKIAQYLKGKTSRKMLQEFTELKKQFWGRRGTVSIFGQEGILRSVREM